MARLDSTQAQASVWIVSRCAPGGLQPLCIPYDKGRERSKSGEEYPEKNTIQRNGFPLRESFGVDQG